MTICHRESEESSFTHLYVLEKPTPHDIGRRFREDASFLLPLLIPFVVLIFAGAVAGPERCFA